MSDAEHPTAGEPSGDSTPADPQRWDQPPLTEVPSDHDFGYRPAFDPGGSAYPTPAYGPGWAMPPAAPVAPTRRRWPWVVSLVSALLVLVLGGAAFAAYQTLNGGGTQPETVLPADTFAFAKLDLDPSASQKIAVARFLHRIPTVGVSFDEKTDLRRSLFDSLSRSGSLPSGISYDADIKPWLGERLAVAARPALVHTDAPDVLVVVQSSDEAKARIGLRRLTAEFGDELGVSFRNGYAILAKSQDLADRAAADAAKGTLADVARYRSDMSRLGGLGVASGWADADALAKLTAGSEGMFSLNNLSTLGQSGRLAYTLRFTADSAEMIVKTIGAPSSTPVEHPAGFPSLGDLPSATAVAVEVGNIDKRIDQGWKALTDSFKSTAGLPGFNFDDLVQQYEHEFGINLPDDLKTVLGSDLLLSVDSQGIGDAPRIAGRSKTDGAAAVAVLEKLKASLAAQGTDLPVTFKPTTDGLAVSNDPAYLQQIATLSGPKLGDDAAFKAALPAVSNGGFAAYVNLEAIGTELKKSGMTAHDVEPFNAFRAVGITSTVDSDSLTIRIRVLAH
jgi:hypothetical protein